MLYPKASRFCKQHTKVNRRGNWQNIKANHKVNTIGKAEMQIKIKCFTSFGATVSNKFQGVLGRIYEVYFPLNDSTYMTKEPRPTKLSQTFIHNFTLAIRKKLSIHNLIRCEIWRLRFLECCSVSTGKPVVTFKRIIGRFKVSSRRMIYHENEGTTSIRIVGNHLQFETV
jgi:hypothetical protein